MFTVVIPLYNKAHTIERTLKSVLNQTFQEFEVVIVNDGSTDNGVDVVETLTNDPRIRIINQENMGVSVARNKGIACAEYDYVALLDGDDEWMPEFLAVMAKAINNYPEAGMYACSSFHRNFVTGDLSDTTIDIYRGAIRKIEYFDISSINMPHTSAFVLSRKSFFLAFSNGEGFPAGMKVGEDLSCFYRLALKFPFVYVGQPLGIRNNNVPGQITSSSHDERIKLMIHVVDFLNCVFEANKSSNNVSFNRFIKHNLRHRILRILLEKDYESFQILWGGLKPEAKNRLSKMERFFYSNKNFKLPSILFIYATKVIWKVDKLINPYLSNNSAVKDLIHKMKSQLKKIVRPIEVILNIVGFNPRKLILLKYIPKYVLHYQRFMNLDGQITHTFPILSDWVEQAGSASGHYFHQDLLVASFIHEKRPARHIDIGSRIDGFVAHVASYRAIEVLDIRPLHSSGHDNISFLQMDLMDTDNIQNECADSISCLHAIEHFGLGRYGDELDPKGHIKGFNNILSMLKTNGTLYISFPIGKCNEVHFNAHRVFHPLDIFSWTDSEIKIELIRFDYIDDSGSLHQNTTPEHIGPELSYGCGIYTLAKIGSLND